MSERHVHNRQILLRSMESFHKVLVYCLPWTSKRSTSLSGILFQYRNFMSLCDAHGVPLQFPALNPIAQFQKGKVSRTSSTNI